MSRAADPRMARSRAAVLGTALELLVERGIAGTTIEAIAQRSGVAKTTIYRQWNSQAALTLDALRSILRPPADPDTGTLRGDLVALLTGFAAALADANATGPTPPRYSTCWPDRSSTAARCRPAQSNPDSPSASSIWFWRRTGSALRRPRQVTGRPVGARFHQADDRARPLAFHPRASSEDHAGRRTHPGTRGRS